jgi:hypothetical protein
MLVRRPDVLSNRYITPPVSRRDFPPAASTNDIGGLMPEAARCNTIEVGQPVLRTGLKIEACDQVEQALIGAIRDRDRQRFLVKSFDIAAD